MLDEDGRTKPEMPTEPVVAAGTGVDRFFSPPSQPPDDNEDVKAAIESMARNSRSGGIAAAGVGLLVGIPLVMMASGGRIADRIAVDVQTLTGGSPPAEATAPQQPAPIQPSGGAIDPPEQAPRAPPEPEIVDLMPDAPASTAVDISNVSPADQAPVGGRQGLSATPEPESASMPAP